MASDLDNVVVGTWLYLVIAAMVLMVLGGLSWKFLAAAAIVIFFVGTTMIAIAIEKHGKRR